MKHLILFFIPLYTNPAVAGLLDVFRLDDGHTNWQYVANTGGTILILALSFTVARLFFSRKEAHSYNRELEAIRNQLEQRVLERTATLDNSNRMLQESNAALEGEISKHQETMQRLRLSESYINNILHSMPLILIGLDKNGAVTQWNRRAEEVSGLPAKTVLGQDLWQAYPTITVSPQQIKQAREQSKTITVKHSQRGQYYFDITIYPLEEPSETGVVILIDDVTQRILAENMLIQRDKMSSMGELAATMALDIDTPFQAILEDVRAVQLHLDNQDNIDHHNLSELLKDALVRGKQASAVIANLLAFSQTRGGDKNLVDITKVIDHSLELANDLLSAPSGLKFRDITVKKHYQDNLPQVPCFVAELQQVFLSLFRHACSALAAAEKPDYEPTIIIQVNEFYDALWIKIQHNGQGISLEEQQFILEPFFSNDSPGNQYDASKRLSFSYFIITEQHRGEMAITSDVNVGTTFHIQLQLK